jgi:hypothetical protein
MGIERQVISQQVDVGGQQAAQALAPDAGHPAILALPEPAVVHQDGIGIALDGSLKQRLAGRDAGHQANDLGTSFHLQTIWAIIPEPSGLQQPVQIIHQFFALHRDNFPCTGCG